MKVLANDFLKVESFRSRWILVITTKVAQEQANFVNENNVSVVLVRKTSS
jgi:hypothetical protein